MSFWLVVILRGKRLPGKVLVLILGSRKCAKACMMIKNKSQDDAWLAGMALGFGSLGCTALLQKLNEGRSTPNPRRIYATRTVSGVPSCVNRFRIAARTCNSAT